LAEDAVTLDEAMARLDAALARLEGAGKTLASDAASGSTAASASIMAERDLIKQKHGDLVRETEGALQELDRLLATAGGN
jgi:hypothetical protein|tara:strand:+ start:45867 stop:46106 length:240 start_codon:yes stop_codon:yes gene_type:complete